MLYFYEPATHESTKSWKQHSQVLVEYISIYISTLKFEISKD